MARHSASHSTHNAPLSPRQKLAKKSVKSAPALRLFVNESQFDKRQDSPASPDQTARERIFTSIVRKTLENPSHPYYSSATLRARQEMIQSIIEQLIPSHYLRRPRPLPY